MPPITFQEAIVAARDTFIEVFLAKVPSYTGASREQMGDFHVTATEATLRFSVPHFLYNEKFNANRVGFNLTEPGPYNVIPAAKAAAEEVLRVEYERQVAAILGRVKWNK